MIKEHKTYRVSIDKRLYNKLRHNVDNFEGSEFIKSIIDFYSEIEGEVPRASMPDLIKLDDLCYYTPSTEEGHFTVNYIDVEGKCVSSILSADNFKGNDRRFINKYLGHMFNYNGILCRFDARWSSRDEMYCHPYLLITRDVTVIE